MSFRNYFAAIGALMLPLAGSVATKTKVPDSVKIDPTTSSVDVAPYSTNTQRFWVVNDGTNSNQYSVFANVCTPYDLYCDWSNTFLGTIASADSVPVDVKFTAGAAGTSGTISFEARINTNQTIRATKTFTVNARQETHLEVAALNPGSAEERDLCLTVAVATDAAYECGDLRLVHALPAVRARGTVRTPTLLYNSRFAHPFGLVAATFSTLPHDLTDVTAILRVPQSGGDIVVTQGFSDALFTASQVQKFVLAFDASAVPTGVYPYTVKVGYKLAGTPDTVTASGELLVVNRESSPFGAGWWLAGYERIFPQNDGSLLWVGGDGSARHYASVGSGVYRAPGIDRPDSITTDTSGNFIRHLRSGASTEFAPNGKHFATNDRLGVATFFHHDQFGQMVHIDPAGIEALRYTFSYIDDTGPLDSVTAPSVDNTARTVLLDVDDGRVLSFRDPDTTSMQFAYDNGSVAEQITSQTNRRGVVQSFVFDAVGKLDTVRAPLNASDTAVTSFCPAESRGYVSTPCSSEPLHPDSAVTVMDGPRTDTTDVTTFRLDRFGAPRVITDALGNVTQVFRGNRDFPGLVTRLVHANGWVNDAYQDSTGLITKLVQGAPLGPNVDAVTEYTWDPKWERITRIIFPERDSVRFAYDSTTGNRIWQEDGRGSTSRADFAYLPDTGNSRLLLSTITYAADAQSARAKDSVAYDALGNVAEAWSGVGTAAAGVTRALSDSVGRVIRTSADITLGGNQQRDTTVYDLMDRVVSTKAYAFGLNPADTVFSTTSYDAEGNRRKVERWAYPDVAASPIGHIVSRWGYDLGDRLVADTASDGNAAYHEYDAADNDTLLTTRRGHGIRMSYDALNRLITRSLDTVVYQTRNQGIVVVDALVPENTPYPRFPIAPSLPSVADTIIGASTETFAYDAMGRLTVADNPEAQIGRSYFANGLLATDTLRIRAFGSSDFSAHTYVTTHAYDLDGRRTAVRYPAQLVGGTMDSASYQYASTNGALEQVTDLQSNVFRFRIDGPGQVDTLYYPGGLSESFAYDTRGRVTTDRMRAPDTTTIRLTTRTYDARDKLLTSTNAVGTKDTQTAAYTGLGYLFKSTYADHGTSALGTAAAFTSFDSLALDGLGNLALDSSKTTGAPGDPNVMRTGKRPMRYEAGTGRLRATTAASGEVDTVYYDASGNTEFTTPSVNPGGTTMIEDRAAYYDALDRVRAIDHRFGRGSGGASRATPVDFAFEEYRYDALGRRVLARTRRFCQASPNSVECPVETIRRTVWDGDRELMEIQMPGADSVSATMLENDTLAVGARPVDFQGNYFDLTPFVGRVAYTNGPLIDEPLSITRFNYADSAFFNRPLEQWATFTLVPHWNLRGDPDNGSFADGSPSNCLNDGSGSRCVIVKWPFGWTATQQQIFGRTSWHGTLIEQKRDGSGLLYKRARYVDPATGRFTQEDPIGLAGGLNVYGFAAGDPLNFADPFGLQICRGYDASPRCIQAELNFAENTTPRDAALMAGAVVVATAGGLAIASASAATMVATTTAVRMAPMVAGATKLTIQFGKVANQVYHTFRHIDEIGLDRATVQAAIEEHLPTVASQLTPGKPLNQIIEVGGQRLQYSAFLLKDGIINVGRIHPVP